MIIRFIISLILALSMPIGCGYAAERLIPLSSQDVSRGELAEMGARISHPEESGTKGVGTAVVFPSSLEKDAIYGIDISHHTFGKMLNGEPKKLDWQNLAGNGVAFVYIKATQGTRYIDGYFKESWAHALAASTAQKPLYRGAYHFLSPKADPKEQVRNFWNVVSNNGGYRPGIDLAPVLDLEWDCKTDKYGRVIRDARGNCAGDNWADLAPEQIIEKVNVALAEAEALFGVRPLVYTNAAWWTSVHLKSDNFLKDYGIWIADYSGSAFRNRKPAMPPMLAEYVLWQFTENGKLMPSCNPLDRKSECIDTNWAFVSKAALLSKLGVKL